MVYQLVAKDPVSSTASVFELEPQEKSLDFRKFKEAWQKGVWNVQFKQPELQIVRAYTPLPPKANEPQNRKDNLRFLIRRDPHGEVSSYLHRLPIGSKVELRGPNLEYELTPDVRQVVFFAGGTGIAPALQVANAMFKDGDSRGRTLHILWANRKREDCIGGYSDAPPSGPVSPKLSWSLSEPDLPFMGEQHGASRCLIGRSLLLFSAWTCVCGRRIEAAGRELEIDLMDHSNCRRRFQRRQ